MTTIKTSPARPTIADVAEKAGVSIATVSRVLNATAMVDEETALRVRLAVEALDYRPHAAARTLASRKTDTLGLLLPEISGAFFQPLLRGVETAASEAGYDLLVHTTRNPNTRGMPRRPLAEHNTDGLLVFTDSLDARELSRLSNTGFPAVLLYQTPPSGIDLPVVTIENKNGARRIVDHLIEVHGCRRILFLRGPQGHEDSGWREQGYCESLQAHNIPLDSSLITGGGFNRHEARQALAQLLDKGLAFDAVFAGADDAAVGVLLALRQAGRRVPDEIALVGFDDQEFASTMLPLLTTVRAPTEQVGLEAVRVLVRLIRKQPVQPRWVLPTELIIRESCGCHSH
ncbi:MAG TPA: LacI family DNA-binding transcriptional regulator [Anaerolineales bacterium]|nr:LacI family DNA-binding transcriptional regulator [Anaerolineales bacterium]